MWDLTGHPSVRQKIVFRFHPVSGGVYIYTYMHACTRPPTDTHTQCHILTHAHTHTQNIFHVQKRGNQHQETLSHTSRLQSVQPGKTTYQTFSWTATDHGAATMTRSKLWKGRHGKIWAASQNSSAATSFPRSTPTPSDTEKNGQVPPIQRGWYSGNSRRTVNYRKPKYPHQGGALLDSTGEQCICISIIIISRLSIIIMLYI